MASGSGLQMAALHYRILCETETNSSKAMGRRKGEEQQEVRNGFGAGSAENRVAVTRTIAGGSAGGLEERL